MPDRIDSELADLQRRGLIGGGPPGAVPPGVAAYAADVAKGVPSPAAPPPMAHDAPPPLPAGAGPQAGLGTYADSLKVPTRQAVSTLVNEENPEVAVAQAQQRQAAAQQGSAPAAAQYVAPHWDQRNVPIRPQTQKEILGTFDHLATAESMQARAKADEASVVADRMAAEGDRAKHSLAARMQLEDERRQEARKQTDRLQQITEAARTGRIDANQVWNAKGTVGKLSAGIGIALGAGVQAVKGGPNVALEILDGEIARNLQEQKANLEHEQQGVLNQDNLLGKYRQVFGDERMAEMAYENSARELAIQQIQTEAAKRQVPEIQANALATITHLRQQQLQTQAEFEKMAFVRGQMVGGGGGTVKQDGNIVRLPDGRSVRFPSEKEAIEARSKLVAAYNTVDMYDQAGKLRKKLDETSAVLHPVEYYKTLHELDSLSERILPEWSLSHGQGQVKEEEAKRYKKNLFPFSAIVDPSADNILKQGREKELTQIDNLVRGSAGEFVDEGYATDKNGRLQKDVELQGRPAQGRKLAMPSGFTPGLGKR